MNNKGKENNQQNIELLQIADNAARFLKTLANSNRLIILGKLVKGECCVGDLEKDLNISQSALSQHLGRMHAEGILSRRRESQQIFYSILDNRVGVFLKITSELFA
ncbi:MAG: winged helix-turn-helix transcriptional regulator [Emcibacteraceae bacterium]|nr:winged helix-turn-helix transcriptional regulator [Emcibacteraceae bacterium]